MHLGIPLISDGRSRWCVKGIDHAGFKAGVDVGELKRIGLDAEGLQAGLGHRVAFPDPHFDRIEPLRPGHRGAGKKIDESGFGKAEQHESLLLKFRGKAVDQLFLHEVDFGLCLVEQGGLQNADLRNEHTESDPGETGCLDTVGLHFTQHIEFVTRDPAGVDREGHGSFGPFLDGSGQLVERIRPGTPLGCNQSDLDDAHFRGSTCGTVRKTPNHDEYKQISANSDSLHS